MPGWMRSKGVAALALAVGLWVAQPALAQQPTPLQQEAQTLYQASDWAGAAEAYERVTAEEPGNGLAWLRLGRALTELGRGEEALEAFGRVPDTGLQTPFLHVFEARALTLLGRGDEAVAVLERIQPSPVLGGGAIVRDDPAFASIVDDARVQSLIEALEAAAWPCRADEMSRQFDFWVGTWDVFSGGTRAGTNRVERILGECTLLENWTNAAGREGKSFNWVDRSSFREPHWRQLWIADQGNTLDYYDGHYADGAMRFSGHTFGPNGDSIPQKLTFIDQHPDTVIQIFEQSNDGGESWVETWRGIYVRRGDGGS